MRTSIPIGWDEGVCLKQAGDWPNSNNAIPHSSLEPRALRGRGTSLSASLFIAGKSPMRDADSTNQRAGLPLNTNNLIFYSVLCWSLRAPDPIKKQKASKLIYS